MGDAVARLPDLGRPSNDSVRATRADDGTAGNNPKQTTPNGIPTCIHPQATRGVPVRDAEQVPNRLVPIYGTDDDSRGKVMHRGAPKHREKPEEEGFEPPRRLPA